MVRGVGDFAAGEVHRLDEVARGRGRGELAQAVDLLHGDRELHPVRQARVGRGHGPVVVEIVVGELVLALDGRSCDARRRPAPPTPHRTRARPRSTSPPPPAPPPAAARTPAAAPPEPKPGFPGLWQVVLQGNW